MTRCFLLVLLFGLLMPSFAQAQLFGKFEKKISSEYVPESACLVAVTFPKRISEDPTFDDLPREILTAWGKKEFGFDPMLIEQVTFIVKEIDSINTTPQWAAVLEFSEMQGLAGVLLNDLEKKKVRREDSVFGDRKRAAQFPGV